MTRLPRVYLAGKIAKHDWRHGLFDVRQSWDQDYVYERPADVIEVRRRGPNERDGFEYAGPFFLGDNHGCFHGPHQHGLINPGYADGPGLADDFPETLTRRTVVRSCLRWLASADVVFCWLESLDAYGTLVELGFAHAHGLPIYLAPHAGLYMDAPPDFEYDPRGVQRPSPLNDLWFACQLASQYESDLDVTYAWKDFVTWWRERMQGYWVRRQRGLEEGGARCPTHRRSNSNWD